jgi:hypothetical protein
MSTHAYKELDMSSSNALNESVKVGKEQGNTRT